MTRGISAIDARRQDGGATTRARPTAGRAGRRAAGAALALLTVAAGCGGDSPLVNFDAAAPEVPFIDQYDPAGKDARYDGTEYCGPALLAGIARARGQGGSLTDAALITLLAGVAGTAPDGTSGNGMIAALRWLGMETGASAGADLGWVDDQLAAGHDVIANGDYYAIPGREKPGLHAGHYIAVTAARDGWAAYRVTDPAGGGDVRWLTDTQLQTFILSHPQGGFTISAW
jgi:hypothetical protein